MVQGREKKCVLFLKGTYPRGAETPASLLEFRVSFHMALSWSFLTSEIYETKSQIPKIRSRRNANSKEEGVYPT